MHTAILITARLKSTRLPRKALRPLRGRPLLARLIERLRLAQRPEGIIVCTSTVPEDDPLEALAHDEGVLCHRGHPEDVLVRLTEAAERFGVETVVSCTADNPFVDPVWIDRLVDYHHEAGNDRSDVAGLPWGVFAHALSARAMRRAAEIKDTEDTEVWGGYFSETGLFRCGVLEVDDEALRWPELRLTVDTIEDYELVSAIFEELQRPGEVFPLEEIVALCRRRPELVAGNAGVNQAPARPIRLRPGVADD